MRPTNEHQRNQLKNSWKHLLRLAGGGVFESFTRVKGPALTKYGSIGHDELDHHVPIDVLLDAELQAGSPVITMLLADLQGYELGRRNGSNQQATIGIQAVHTVLSDAVRVVDEIQKAVADGLVNSAERAAIRAEIWRAIRDLYNIDKGL